MCVSGSREIFSATQQMELPVALTPDAILPPADKHGIDAYMPFTREIVSIPPDLPDELRGYYLSLSPDERETLSWMDAKMRNEQLMVRLKATQETDSDTAQRVAKGIHEKVVTTASQEQLRLFSPFPTEMTRTSPFFPMSKNEMGDRPYLKDMVIADHSWGTIRYSGPKLSVFEEDMLMILLAALNDANSRRVGEVEGSTTYTYRGTLAGLLRLKGIPRPGKSQYTEALNAFKLMTGAVFELKTTQSVGAGKAKRAKKTNFKNIISGGEYDHETGEFTITVNPYFYETYAAGQVTWLDVAMRTQIKSPIAKALYRFMQSHRDDRWYGPIMTLAASLNLDLDLPLFKIRDRIRGAIKDLVALNVLLPGSIVEGNNVTLFRCAGQTSSKKQLQKPKEELPG